MSEINWCRYFAAIEADPHANAPQLTVRQFYEAKEHLNGCDTCHIRVERVMARAAEQNYFMPGMN